MKAPENIPWGWIRRGLGWIFDLLIIALLVKLGLELWPSGMTPGTPPLPKDAPGWASFNDYLLAGPDAGEWASAAVIFTEGRYAELDPHRMPTWTLMTAFAMRWIPEPALAGHLVNHLLQLSMPPILYLLGKAVGGRGVGLGAAVTMLYCPNLLESSRRFGVDPTVFTLVPATLLASFWGGRVWALAPLAGAVGALCMSSHFSAVGFAIPGLFMVLAAGQPGWRRWLAGFLYAAGCAGAAWWIFQYFQAPTTDLLSMAVAEGIAPERVESGGGGDAGANWDKARVILESGALTAADDAVAGQMRLVRPWWVPWLPALLLPWIGVFGLGLPPGRRPRGDGWRLALRVILGGLPLGIPLVLALAPLPFLAAAMAPERYAFNLAPIVAILMLRGLASGPALIERLIQRRWRAWPMGILMIPLGAYWGDSMRQMSEPWLNPKPPILEDVATWRLSQALAAEFEPGGDAASPNREASVMAGLDYCPETNCPFTARPSDFMSCLQIMNEECAGEGPIPYVVVIRPENDERSEERRAMDAWVLEQWPALRSVETRAMTAHVTAIPREEIPERKDRRPPPL